LRTFPAAELHAPKKRTVSNDSDRRITVPACSNSPSLSVGSAGESTVLLRVLVGG
jgi:hypothetical protein